MVISERRTFLNNLADKIASLNDEHIQKVAIDGVDGAGKTVLANELAPLVEQLGRPVIRASIDGFHNPREVRYRLGRNSPEGFFRESYNYPLLRSLLLDPLNPGGSRRYKTAAYDVEKDSPVALDDHEAIPGSILILDGIFLHRPELKSYWDFSIFLSVPFDISIPRGALRGNASADPSALSNLRYVEGQKLYLTKCRPELHASLVVDYRDLNFPKIQAGTKL